MSHGVPNNTVVVPCHVNSLLPQTLIDCEILFQ